MISFADVKNEWHSDQRAWSIDLKTFSLLWSALTMDPTGIHTLWVNGALIPWDDAKEHMLAHTLHYGVGAFEGIRLYPQENGPSAIFQLSAHIKRLFESSRICSITIPFSQQEIEQACIDVCLANKLSSGYLRPIVFLGAGTLGLGNKELPIRTAIIPLHMDAYLGKTGLADGIRTTVSGFRRPNLDAFVSKGKICGQYITNVLAKRDAIQNGYDEAIMLDDHGLVAEGTGENIFIIRDNVIFTPPTTSPILPGITRLCIIEIARQSGYTVIEQSFTHDELWIADEIFLVGTAAEVTPVREVDHHVIGTGTIGPITKKIQTEFFDIVYGRKIFNETWSTPLQ